MALPVVLSAIALACAVPSGLVVEPLMTVTTPEDKALKGNIPVSGDKKGARFKAGLKAAHGTVELDAGSGAFVYQPAPDFFGGDGFTVEVSDGSVTLEVVVRVQVTPVNDPPLGRAQALRTIEDKTGVAAAIFRDVDGDALSFRVTRGPAHGQAEVDAKTGVVRFTPTTDFFGADAIVVEASDGTASATAEVTIEVRPENDPPVVEPLVVKTDEDRAVEGVVAARDPERDPLRFRVVTPPRAGTLASFDEKSGRFSYAPAANANGADSFAVEASDGSLRSEATTMRVEIAPVNDAPVAKGAALSTDEDKVGTATVTASDIDGDKLSFRLKKGPAHGVAEVDAQSGVVRFTPSADWFGTDSVTVEASDGSTQATAEFTIEARAVNDVPVVEPLEVATNEDKAVEGAVVGRDVERELLRFRVTKGPRLGSLERFDEKTGAFRYVPAADAFGADSFVVEVADAASRSEGSVSVTVSPVNDPPMARAPAVTTNEDVPVDGRVEASDVDKDALRFTLARAPALGEARIDEKTGAFRYTPAADRNGADVFDVVVSDGTATVTAEVKVGVAAVNDAPRVQNETVECDEDTPVTARLPGVDPDGDPLVFRIAQGAVSALGKLEITDDKTGAFRFIPARDANGEVAVIVEVVAGRDKVQGTLNVRVRPVNDAPTVKPMALETEEDKAVEAVAERFDVDGDALTLRLTSAPPSGTVRFGDAGRVSYVPARDVNGELRFSIVADDGKAVSEPAEVVVKIAPVNDVPTVQPASFALDEDTPLSERLRAVDIDGDAVMFSLLRQPTRGKVTLDASTGAFTYEPTNNLFGEDRFTFAASDGKLTSGPAEVVLMVRAVDDPPRAYAGDLVVGKRGRFEGILQGYDPEGARLRYRIDLQPAGGVVELVDAATGRFTFKSDGTGEGTTSFRFSVTDGKLWSEPADVVITFR